MAGGWRSRAARAGVSVLSVTALVAGPTVVALPAKSLPQAAAAPSSAADERAWTASHDAPSKYPNMSVDWDVPIAMSDGTVLKANVFHPADAAGRPIATRTPTIVNVTPYTKLVSAIAQAAVNVPVLSQGLINLLNLLDFSGTPIAGVDALRDDLNSGMIGAFAMDPKLIESGYTMVVVDVRGTGNSQGVWDVFGNREQRDTIEILDWVRRQRFTNGRLGMTGMSYSGINQLQAASKQPAGLQALFPVVPSADLVSDIVAPGGGLGVGFLGPWLALVNGLKFIPDLRSLLNGTFDWKWLASRLQNPAVFVPELVSGVTAPTVAGLTPTTQQLLDPNSELRRAYHTPLDEVTTPTFAIGAWHDLFTGTEWQLLQRLTALPDSKKKLVMSDRYHATVGSDLNKRGAPPRIDVLQKAWFDHWLKGVDNGIQDYQSASIHRLGGGWWRGGTFPEPGQSYQRLYLSGTPSGTARGALADGTLQTSSPHRAAERTVAPGLSTLCSNDTGQAMFGLLVFQGCTDDNRLAESNGLTFTSAPVSKGTVVSGPINLHLLTKLDATDGYWSVMVTDVGPDGRSSVISSGQLTTSLRDVDDSRSSKASNGDYTLPYYRLDVADRKLVKPGQLVPLDIGTHATDAYLAPGHRLRVDVFALNLIKGMSLGPVTSLSGLRPQHVVIDPKQPSYLVVPSDRPLR
ncbi:CocE/NonD family hydrolase [Tsukamurella sp. 8F]|uniref:CocE/NonD family hydrolase n=1 Tax=unclassified Tsukamurella TaxID=2633480 RepID=UPI0023BA3308|nr:MULTISPECIES: CocE/NonD family hydrolase [unclassified Tsukamurella]MDF0532553.1 CocE/NonD family hydrolase [Tsukamurella sp. 8J]MDF0589484.1 CocE/NonD family hydrolase [Tsukamurella sp. 8F]